MRRLTVLGAAAALLAACGGGESATEVAPAAKPDPTTPQPALVAGPVAYEPTAEQLAARKRLLAEIAAGTYDCGCSATARHLDRVRSSKAKAPAG